MSSLREAMKRRERWGILGGLAGFPAKHSPRPYSDARRITGHSIRVDLGAEFMGQDTQAIHRGSFGP
jgi:hypothetical protein